MNEHNMLTLEQLFGPAAEPPASAELSPGRDAIADELEHQVLMAQASDAGWQPESDQEPGAGDERWEALAADTLSEHEKAAFIALASRSARGRHAVAALAPLSRDVRRRMVDAITDELAQQPALSADSGAPPAEAKKASRVHQERPRSARSKPWLRLGWWLGPLLAAAAAILWFGLPSEPTPLPAYEIGVAEAGSKTMRSAGLRRDGLPLRVRLGAGERFRLVLRPLVPVQGPVAVRGYLIRDEQPRRWQPTIEQAPSGAFLIAGDVDDWLVLDEGSWTVALAVGRPDALPNEAQLMEALAAPHAADWQLLTQRLVIQRGAR